MSAPASLFALCALLFAALTWQVAGHGPLRALDERAGRALSAWAVPSWLAEFFADLGNTVVALPALLVACGYAAWRLRQAGRDVVAPWWLPPLGALLALGAVPALVVPLKLWLARPGPPRMAGGVHDGFYPSGHGATAAVAYGLAALLLARAARGRRGGRVLAAGVVVLNAGVGAGLVRQGYHWPLDVLGGWCLAGMVLAVWCVVCRRWAEPSGVRADAGGRGSPA